MDLRSRILFLSVATNAASMCMIATMMPTSTVNTRIALLPVPNQIMMSGPSAILGSAFNTTMYGSNTFLSVSLHQSASAIPTPSTTAIAKPARVSQRVVPMW